MDPPYFMPHASNMLHLVLYITIVFCVISECGGKNFHFVHPSADVQNVVMGTIRSAYEYSGQKCSAVSRMYVAKSRWDEIKNGLVAGLKDVKLGSPMDPTSFLSAVIDEKVSSISASCGNF